MTQIMIIKKNTEAGQCYLQHLTILISISIMNNQQEAVLSSSK